MRQGFPWRVCFPPEYLAYIRKSFHNLENLAETRGLQTVFGLYHENGAETSRDTL